ncbi:aminotransferase class I/II-fold pyridoxal phosphate-dependent enzyme [Paenarthrobacter sp. NPDC058040]|uniref:aminotransferase class I/II-fold pyridoxal phosphate-dependent enzyme n=1 Tax=unclassified Paenarthrobacter TaxID=2634190 RepID=UPI0036DAB5C3
MDQSQAPILDALHEYHRLDRYGFTPPGHRQGRGADNRTVETLGADTFRSDLLSTAGLDDRKSSNGYLSTAEQLMADAVGADKAFFSTCGSSLSVKASILAVTQGKGDLLIGRDAHKSVVAGLILSGLQPRWINPQYDSELHLAHPPSPEEVEKMWQRYPDARAAFITSPTPHGTCADIGKIAEICHSRGKPLIIDEAWGAHLPFHDSLPTWAMDAGADICVVSVHKMGMGFEQGSIYHLQGNLVDSTRLSQCADLLSTTSANVMIYAAIDGWRRQMVQDGKNILDKALHLADSLRKDIEQLQGIHVLGPELIRAEASHDLDPLHVLMDVSELGISGYQAADWLRAECRLDVGLSDHRRIEATLSQSDNEESTDRLLVGLRQLIDAAPDMPKPKPVQLPEWKDLEADAVMLPRDAFFGPVENVPFEEAAGRIAAEQITPYPPGIPAVLPGERINQPVLDYLRSGVEAGMVLPDPADPGLGTVRVVAQQREG